MDIRHLVETVERVLGPAASAAQIERIVESAIAATPKTGTNPVATAASSIQTKPHARVEPNAPIELVGLTLGISLLDCGSRLSKTLHARVYDKIRRTADQLVRGSDAVSDRFGVGPFAKGITTTPIGLLTEGQSVSDIVGLGEVLDRAAEHVGADRITGFSALVQNGSTKGDRRLIQAMSPTVASTSRVNCSVHCASPSFGVNADVVVALAESIVDAARRTEDSNSIGSVKIAGCSDGSNNAVVGVPYHGPDRSEAVINVVASATGAVMQSVRALGEDAGFALYADAIAQAAAMVARNAEIFGRHCVEQLSHSTGTPLSFGKVDLTLSKSSDGHEAPDILHQMGIRDGAAPGAAAASALILSALDAGLSGSRHSLLVGGLAFNNAWKWKAPLGSNPETLALPGDTAPETIAGILLDAFADGVSSGRPTLRRIVPIIGLTAGDSADLGNPFGVVPVCAVPTASNSPFVLRGGCIPLN